MMLQLIDRANKWAELLQQTHRVHFHLANATVSFQSMLSSYPGPVQLVSIQVSHTQQILQRA